MCVGCAREIERIWPRFGLIVWSCLETPIPVECQTLVWALTGVTSTGRRQACPWRWRVRCAWDIRAIHEISRAALGRCGGRSSPITFPTWGLTALLLDSGSWRRMSGKLRPLVCRHCRCLGLRHGILWFDVRMRAESFFFPQNDVWSMGRASGALLPRLRFLFMFALF